MGGGARGARAAPPPPANGYLPHYIYCLHAFWNGCAPSSPPPPPADIFLFCFTPQRSVMYPLQSCPHFVMCRTLPPPPPPQLSDFFRAGAASRHLPPPPPPAKNPESATDFIAI